MKEIDLIEYKNISGGYACGCRMTVMGQHEFRMRNEGDDYDSCGIWCCVLKAGYVRWNPTFAMVAVEAHSFYPNHGSGEGRIVHCR